VEGLRAVFREITESRSNVAAMRESHERREGACRQRFGCLIARRSRVGLGVAFSAGAALGGT
jgi:hypothetical protein